MLLARRPRMSSAPAVKTFDTHENSQEETDLMPVRSGRLRNLGDPANDGGHLALLEDLRAPSHDDVERAIPVPGPKQILDGQTHIASLEMPAKQLG